MARRLPRQQKAPAPTPPAVPAAAAPATPSGWSVEYLDETVVAEATAWPASLRANLQRIIDRVESQGLFSLTEEHAKHIRDEIWEFRPDADGMQGRAFYATTKGKRVVIVLCKIKKTKKTPNRWITQALLRAANIV
jgi:phage-related protein